MLTFVIPVKSKQVATDWSRFCSLFERTLKSICNQTDESFKVLAVCHEIPEVDFKHENIHFLQVDFEPPDIREADKEQRLRFGEIDKGNKVKQGVAFAKSQFNSDYVMIVDSDDYISRKISAFVNNSDKNNPGWYIKNGYIHVYGKKFLLKTYKFNELCGSCIIFKPELVKYLIGIDSVLYFDHRLTTLNGTIKLSKLPFNGGIYSIANGENHLMSTSNVKKFNNHSGWISVEGLKRIFNKIRNYSFRYITPSLRREFNFYPQQI